MFQRDAYCTFSILALSITFFHFSVSAAIILPKASGGPITATPGTDGFGTIQQGFLETSNVNVVAEITDLITAQRAYEMNSKVIQASDQMMGTLTQLR